MFLIRETGLSNSRHIATIMLMLHDILYILLPSECEAFRCYLKDNIARKNITVLAVFKWITDTCLDQCTQFWIASSRIILCADGHTFEDPGFKFALTTYSCWCANSLCPPTRIIDYNPKGSGSHSQEKRAKKSHKFSRVNARQTTTTTIVVATFYRHK